MDDYLRRTLVLRSFRSLELLGNVQRIPPPITLVISQNGAEPFSRRSCNNGAKVKELVSHLKVVLQEDTRLKARQRTWHITGLKAGMGTV